MAATPTIRPKIMETGGSGTSSSPVVSIESHHAFKAAPVEIDEIYYSVESIESPYLRNALPLISQAFRNVDNAIELLEGGDRVGGDDEMQHFQTLLPELFACRPLGEGFALVVSSLQNAVLALRGKPMEDRQIRGIRSTLIAIRSEPFMTFDAALEHVSRLERVNLNVDPPNFEYLADLLSE